MVKSHQVYREKCYLDLSKIFNFDHKKSRRALKKCLILKALLPKITQPSFYQQQRLI